jgi:hypothetical protein
MRLPATLALAPLAFAVALARDAAARPPSYTMHAGFRTSLQNVPDGERREECLDLACHEKGGTLVAQGSSTHDGVALTVRIREYRHHPDQSAQQLQTIAQKMLAKGVDDRELRLVAGKVAERPALEQWSVVNPCQRELGGRVLLSLSDKVVEVEAVATTQTDGADVPKAISQISSVLHGVRVRRVGDVTVDPAADAPPAAEVSEALKKGCL